MPIVKKRVYRQIANHMKIQIANFIHKKFGIIPIASEVMYGSSRKVVDMMFIYKENLYGIEIKSYADNVQRLPGQLNEYGKVFDYIIIFSSENHICEIKSMIDPGIGLYQVDDRDIEQIIRPKKNNNRSKLEMLSCIPSNIIRRYFSIKGNYDSHEIRMIASKKSIRDIHNLLINHFRDYIAVH